MLAAVNEHLAVAGLSITREDALMLAERRVESLAETERIEFGPPAVAAIAKAIASSPFLMQDNLADVLAELQDAFYTIRPFPFLCNAPPGLRRTSLRHTR